MIDTKQIEFLNTAAYSMAIPTLGGTTAYRWPWLKQGAANGELINDASPGTNLIGNSFYAYYMPSTGMVSGFTVNFTDISGGGGGGAQRPDIPIILVFVFIDQPLHLVHAPHRLSPETMRVQPLSDVQGLLHTLK